MVTGGSDVDVDVDAVVLVSAEVADGVVVDAFDVDNEGGGVVFAAAREGVGDEGLGAVLSAAVGAQRDQFFASAAVVAFSCASRSFCCAMSAFSAFCC